jgi:hypothetical protein
VLTQDTTPFETWRRNNGGFDALIRFVGPVLTASIAAALFLFCWYGWTKRRYLAKARKHPQDLVVTAGPDIAEVVGREEIAQVIAERLRERDTRSPICPSVVSESGKPPSWCGSPNCWPASVPSPCRSG